jgi:hypothetical protein
MSGQGLAVREEGRPGPGCDPESVLRMLREGAEPVARLAALVPASRGKRCLPSTLVRWILFGKRGVRLEGFVGPGKSWHSSAPALARFFARLTEIRCAGERFPPASPAADDKRGREREERSARAAEAMERLGRPQRKGK